MTRDYRGRSDWTPERDELLRKLGEAGQSGSQIGEVMGKSRQSIISRSHKIGVTLHGMRRYGEAPRPKPVAMPAPVRPPSRPLPKPIRAPKPAPVLACEAVLFLEARWSAGEPVGCRYPLWDDTTPSAARTVCGAPIERSPYCEFHDTRTHQRGQT